MDLEGIVVERVENCKIAPLKSHESFRLRCFFITY